MSKICMSFDRGFDLGFETDLKFGPSNLTQVTYKTRQ